MEYVELCIGELMHKSAIKNALKESEYLKCWSSMNGQPAFESFVNFINDKLSAYPLETMKNLAIELHSNRPGRIDIKGSFTLESVLWKLSGEIVWLAKSSTFRGHVFLDSRDALLTGEDLLEQRDKQFQNPFEPNSNTERRPNPTSKEKLKENLNKISEIYKIIRSANNEPTDNPGISRSEILETFQAIGLTPSEDLMEIYEWKNGIIYLNAFLSFLPLNNAIDIYKNYQLLREANPNFTWKNIRVPVLDMNGDVQVCLDIETNELYSIDVECDFVQKIADNYSSYISAIYSILNSGQFSFNEGEGCITVEPDTWEKLLDEYKIINAW